MKLIKMAAIGTSGRVSLTFSDGKSYRTPDYVAAEYALYPGCELSDERYAAFQSSAGAASAKERAVRIISAADLSEKELSKRLQAKGEKEQDAQGAVQWLKELELLDDKKTAAFLVASAVSKGYGAARIRNILYEKGIPRELWDEALAELPEADDAIDRYIRKHLSGTDCSDKQIKKTVDALLRRGHSWKDIQNGLRRFRDDLELEEDIQEEFS